MSSAGIVDYAVFAVTVSVLLIVDLAYASRRPQGRSTREAWGWTALWIAVALLFGAWIAVRLGAEAGLAYLTAYLLEKSLSVDNLAVFALVFAQTGIVPALQHRALFWGIIGTLVMRAILIGLGLYLMEQFQWIVYPFAALLVYGAVGMLRGPERPRRVAEATCRLCTSWVARWVPITPVSHGARFVVRLNGRLHATPLLVALAAIESADFVFALDSVPAVFAVTRDPFLVYTSNVLALLGLRSLYVVLGDLIGRFRYLRFGLGVLLLFVAAKLALSGVFHLSAGISLGVIGAILAVSIAASLLRPLPAQTSRNVAQKACVHRGEIKHTVPAVQVCEQCQALGDRWVQLRLCTSCGHVGCCDSSKNRHATKHFQDTGHPIIQTVEPGERWRWCYVDKTMVD